MTYRNRERVARTFAHQEPDRVPFCTYGPEKALEEVIHSLSREPDERSCFLEGDFKYIGFKAQPDPERYRPFLPGLPDGADITDWGVGQISVSTERGEDAGYRRWHPLAGMSTHQELEDYPWPDFSDPRRHADLGERIRAAQDEGYTVLGQMSETILETCYGLRGIEQLMLNFYERPEFVETLFEKVAQRRRFQAGRLMEAGADILRIGDDIATQEGLIIGPELYRQRIKPFHASAIAAARKVRPDVPVLYHSDGNITALIGELMDAGVTAIHPMQPECVDLAALKREYGKDLVFCGCLPMQSVFSGGSHDDVRKYLRFLMDEIAPGGGLVVEFYGVLITPKLVDNARIFYEEFYDLARY